jgi:hypothetical protein
VFGSCNTGYQCDTISSEIAFCSSNGAVPTNDTDCSANGIDDCADGQQCLTDASNNAYCVDLCDSPASTTPTGRQTTCA